MKSCFKNCLSDGLKWVLGAAAISGIVAFILGISIAVGPVAVAFPPGVIAALVAIAGVAVLGALVMIGSCYARCYHLTQHW